MDSKKIGAFIAVNRKKKGLIQEQLGERLGVTNKTISRCPAMWFKISDMKPLKYDTLISNFLGSSSGGDTSQILNSLCPAFFIKSTQDIEI